MKKTFLSILYASTLIQLNGVSNNLNTLNEDNPKAYFKKAAKLAHACTEWKSKEEVRELYSRNLPKAKELFEKSYNLGYKRAYYDLIAIKAMLFSENMSQDKPTQEDINSIQEAISNWPKCNQYWLALRLCFIKDNNQYGPNIYLESARILAYSYPDGTDEEIINSIYHKNLPIAKQLFKKASKLGHQQAFYDLITTKIIMFAENISQDEPTQEDIDFMLEAIKTGTNNPHYNFALGALYRIINKPNWEHYLEKSAKLKHSRALFYLSLIYINDLENPELREQNIIKSCDYLTELINISKNRFFENKFILLTAIHFYENNETARNSMQFYKLLVLTYQFFQKLILQKKLKFENDPSFYNKIMRLKNKLKNEVLRGAI